MDEPEPERESPTMDEISAEQGSPSPVSPPPVTVSPDVGSLGGTHLGCPIGTLPPPLQHQESHLRASEDITCHTASQGASRDAWLARLTAFYRQHNPDKLCRVAEMLDQFEGQEEDLWVALQDKYVYCTPPPPAVPADHCPPPNHTLQQQQQQRHGSPSRLLRPTASFSGKQNLRTRGHVVLSLTKGTAKGRLGLTFSGSVVSSVEPGGPACRGGVKPGMHILTVDGEPVGEDAGAVMDAMRRAPLTFSLCARQQVERRPLSATRSCSSGGGGGRGLVGGGGGGVPSPPPPPPAASSPGRRGARRSHSHTPPPPGRGSRGSAPATGAPKALGAGRAPSPPAAAAAPAAPAAPPLGGGETQQAAEGCGVGGRRRYHEMTKPAVPHAASVRSGSARSGRSGRHPSRPGSAAGAGGAMSRSSTPSGGCGFGVAPATPWVSVMTQGRRGSLTATEVFEQRLQQRGTERQMELEEQKRRDFEQERLHRIQERLFREEGEKARLLEAKMQRWEELVSKKEKVLQQRLRRSQRS